MALITGKQEEIVPETSAKNELSKIQKDYGQMKQEHHAEQNVTRPKQNNLEMEQQKREHEDQKKLQEEEQEKAKKRQEMNNVVEVVGKQTGSPFKRKSGVVLPVFCRPFSFLVYRLLLLV